MRALRARSTSREPAATRAKCEDPWRSGYRPSGTGEQVPEVLLVALGHPEVERARVEVGAEAPGSGAGRTAADLMGVKGVGVLAAQASLLGPRKEIDG